MGVNLCKGMDEENECSCIWVVTLLVTSAPYCSKVIINLYFACIVIIQYSVLLIIQYSIADSSKKL